MEMKESISSEVERGKIMENMQLQHIKIQKLGPIDYCEIDVEPMMVLTGAQGAGKSTVAKAIYFFKMFKVIVLQQIQKEQLIRLFMEEKNTLQYRIMKELRSVFLQEFGSTWGMSSELCLHYEFDKEYWISLKLIQDKNNPNYIWIEFSEKLRALIKKWEKQFVTDEGAMSAEEIKDVIAQDMNDRYDVVYIPAGRSMMTLLSSHINYMYSTMDDVQKRMIDYCTKNYLEMTMKLKPAFAKSRGEMIDNVLQTTTERLNRNVMSYAQKLMERILKGEYLYSEGEERLLIDCQKKNYVKINFASSGQQESVWILNILFYYLLYGKKTYVIIEEPESHLFPDAQKVITEFITLFYNQGNQVLLTTHSPYVLGSLNNMLYANKLNRKGIKEIEKVVNSKIWLDDKKMEAYFVADGKTESCKDIEMCSIKNEVIDEVSGVINEEFDKLLELYHAGKDEEC